MTQLAVPIPQAPLNFGPGTSKPVDILTGFSDDDLISCAFPDFPKNNINLISSFIDITSNPDGNFGIGPTDSVAFSDSLTPLVNGNSEFRFQRQFLVSVDLSSITGIRFRIDATASCTFRCLAIRLLDKDWVYAPVDLDTLNNRVVRPVSPTGSVTAPPVFPTSPGEPFDFPILWRSDRPSGLTDPTPIDGKFSVAFNTGSMVTAVGGPVDNPNSANQISLYLRQRSADFLTQLDLDGFLMDDLNGDEQPEFGDAPFTGRSQYNLDGIPDGTIPVPDASGFTMGELDQQNQFQLERAIDPISVSYIAIDLKWGAAGASLTIDNTEVNDLYEFNLTLLPKHNYALVTELEDRAIRVRIFSATTSGYLEDEIFDTTLITDPAIFQRHKGRVGWYTHFEDGDAFMRHLRSSQLNFAEWRSHQFESISPVEGVQLHVGASPDRQHFTGIDPSPWGGNFTPYPDKSPFAFKVDNPATSALQGIQSNAFYLADLPASSISFELFVPKQGFDQGFLYAFLWDGFAPIPLNLGALKPDVWNQVKIPLTSVDTPQGGGIFTFVLVQTITGQPSYWIIDHIQVKERVIDWEARDAFERARFTPKSNWIPFKTALNNVNHGVVLDEPNPGIQLRAQARRQDVQIDQIRAIPKYAGLGRFVWSDQESLPPSTSIIADFSYSGSNRLITFTQEATQPESFYWPISYEWEFGDGLSDVGPIVRHKYADNGTYRVSLIITDNHGRRTSTHQDITI